MYIIYLPRKKNNLLIIVFLYLLLFLFCYDAYTKEYSISICYNYAVPSLNPIKTYPFYPSEISTFIFDSLGKITEKGEVVPFLAKDWSLSIGKGETTIYLKQGILFHNGDELTSKVVVNILKKWVKKVKIERIRDIKAISRYTLKVYFTEFSRFDLFRLLLFPILLTSADGKKDYGTGPYFVKSFKNRGDIVLERFKRYFGREAKIKYIRFYFAEDETLNWARLLRSETDFAFNIDLYHYFFLKKEKGIKTGISSPKEEYLIILNHHIPLFKSKKIRKALMYAINRERLAEKICGDKWYVSHGLFLPQWKAFNKSVSPYPYSPQKALSLFKEEGWRFSKKTGELKKNGNPFYLTLLFYKGAEDIEIIARMIQQDLFLVGIRTKLVIRKTTELFSKKDVSESSCARLVPVNLGLIPENIEKWAAFSDGIFPIGYKNKKLEKMIKEALKTEEREKSFVIYQKIDKILADELPMLFLFLRPRFFAYKDKFITKGTFEPSVLGLRSIKDWELKE